jgi:hypothetical protein
MHKTLLLLKIARLQWCQTIKYETTWRAFQAPLGQGTNVLVIIRVLIIHASWKD